MKKKFIGLFILLACGFVFAEEPVKPKYELKKPTGDPAKFVETWGYVDMDRSKEYKKEIPITDVCYFAAEVDTYGELSCIPVRSQIDIGTARAHMVVVCNSRSLAHFVINPDFELRKKLINDIVAASKDFDGVQLDLELIPKKDRKHYITFIADLRYKLQGKMLSVCVPARFKLLTDDIYPYAEIAKYCDRVFIMAYDEHWSGSRPGAVASVDWCKKVLDYAHKVIPENKLVMGIPFYGRTWSNKTTASAWYFSGANRVMRENNVTEVTYENDIPKFTYTTNVTVTGYFNDAYSVLNLCRLYEKAGVKKVGFWRIGQEDPDFWNYLKIK